MKIENNFWKWAAFLMCFTLQKTQVIDTCLGVEKGRHTHTHRQTHTYIHTAEYIN